MEAFSNYNGYHGIYFFFYFSSVAIIAVHPWRHTFSSDFKIDGLKTSLSKEVYCYVKLQEYVLIRVHKIIWK